MSSRRNFVKQTAALGAGIALAPQLTFGSSSIKKTLNIGLIGVGLRGINHLNNLLLRDDCKVTAICDIDSKRISIAQDLITKKSQNKAKVFGKYD
ncbi:MAG: twin-arginine translocation signal domain-containing protein, partial [Flavobacteriales bacterium]